MLSSRHGTPPPATTTAAPSQRPSARSAPRRHATDSRALAPRASRSGNTCRTDDRALHRSRAPGRHRRQPRRRGPTRRPLPRARWARRDSQQRARRRMAAASRRPRPRRRPPRRAPRECHRDTHRSPLRLPARPGARSRRARRGYRPRDYRPSRARHLAHVHSYWQRHERRERRQRRRPDPLSSRMDARWPPSRTRLALRRARERRDQGARERPDREHVGARRRRSTRPRLARARAARLRRRALRLSQGHGRRIVAPDDRCRARSPRPAPRRTTSSGIPSSAPAPSSSSVHGSGLTSSSWAPTSTPPRSTPLARTSRAPASRTQTSSSPTRPPTNLGESPLIVTNPPMGRRVQRGTHGELLERFVDHAARVLVPGGVLVWAAPDPASCRRAQRKPGSSSNAPSRSTWAAFPQSSRSTGSARFDAPLLVSPTQLTEHGSPHDSLREVRRRAHRLAEVLRGVRHAGRRPALACSFDRPGARRIRASAGRRPRLGTRQRPGDPVRAGTDLEGQPVRADGRPATRARARPTTGRRRVHPGRARDHGSRAWATRAQLRRCRRSP